MTAALGAIGWACAGPLAATLLVGRSALFFPSARWLLIALLWWLATGVVARRAGARPTWADALPTPPDPAWRALSSLALLAVAAPLLPLLYIDDTAYHLTRGGTSSPAYNLAGYLLALAVVGPAVQALMLHITAAGSRTPSFPARAQAAPWRPGAAAFAPLLSIAIILGINRGLLVPLQAQAPPAAAATFLLALNLAASVLAAAAGSAAVGAGTIGIIAIWAAWATFPPWQEALAVGWQGDVPAGLAPLLAATGLLLIQRGRAMAAGTLLGVLAALVPATGAALAALALLGLRRPALAGCSTAALLFLAKQIVTAFASPPARAGAAARPLNALDLSLPQAMWGALQGTPHEANVAAGAFHLRLFLGPGFLTTPEPPPHVAPALILTLAALAISAWLIARLITSTALGTEPPSRIIALCLALVSGLVLAGTTPRSGLPLAMLAILPLANPRAPVWRDLPIRLQAIILSLAVTGYLLAGTSMRSFTLAAAPFISRWPPLASLPTLGLLLLATSLSAVLVASATKRE